MPFTPNNIYHVNNQGNNRQIIFFQRRDYLIFLTLYKRLFPSVCSTIAWCLMPNHFHFMIYADERCSSRIKQGGIYIDPITNSIRKLLSGYARIFNNNYRQTGSVFRQKTKSKCLSAIPAREDSPNKVHEYYINCFHYIHQNPLRAGLTEYLENWEFSSFLDYAGLRNGSLCEKGLARLHCGFEEEIFYEHSYKKVKETFIDLFT